MASGDILSVIKPSDYNWLINGDMNISQRGDYTSPLVISTSRYTLDRWKTEFTNVGVTVQQVSVDQPLPLNNTKSFKVAATSSHASGNIQMAQEVENYENFFGRTVTFSSWVKSNRTCSLLVADGIQNQYSSEHSGSGQWELLSMTVDISLSALRVKCYVSTWDGDYGQINAGEYLEYTGAQLVIANAAGPFIPRPEAEELRLCHRYYYASPRKLHIAGSCYQSNSPSGGLNTMYSYPVTMRTIPMISFPGFTDGGSFSTIDYYEVYTNLDACCILLASTDTSFSVWGLFYLVLDAEI